MKSINVMSLVTVTIGHSIKMTPRSTDHRHRGRVVKVVWRAPHYHYRVRPRETYTLEAQLGLIPATKSKIEDGSATRT